jgi:uncharacterized protein (DUF4415 family)
MPYQNGGQQRFRNLKPKYATKNIQKVDVIKRSFMKNKKKVGRPAIKNNPKKSKMVYISEEAHRFYESVGKGNFSKGVEIVFGKSGWIDKK